ncbi:putative serine/threonine protein kinase [Labilithrix luteola]|uniref:Putative serine/threonine protein kinase n=1 Tax=Labilithrix luteola TaxID=1391654 RepID=A0A0K1QGL2_9BACT|nr:serine/threonine-protein kinase [Labilithrix luteola]AKV04787.1 putative serine/threonine protein kinase [Labilithrix luteola]
MWMDGRRDARLGRVLMGNAQGRWRVDAELGHGGTSTVYAATNVETGTRAAIKLLNPEFSQHPRMLKILLAEARLVAAIEHPGTVKVLDDGIAEDGCAFLVFELLVGRTLEELRQAHGGRVPLDEMMRIGDAVMDALCAVHAAGVVHRDLKPSNIYVLEGGGVKLLDFGFAKLSGYTADAAQNVVGTPSYMPPEQALGLTKKVDAQSDVWSLAATLFHVLSGQPVHIARHVDAMMLASASVRPRSLAEAVPEMASAVVAVVDQALSYRKADRFPDMAAMRAAWQGAHPHWLPTLPPPSFSADPEFLEAALLEPEFSPPSNPSLFDPRELVDDSVKPQVHPGALPKRGAKPAPSVARPRRILPTVVAIGAALFLALSIASAIAVMSDDASSTHTQLRH